ncbi:hypothetical protein F9U64_10810 [Gracilibacillus oryzae]|uniref:Uncharacterized protein n=1 Tax=Gracilibacillus oryzae TaxID=1672701 RepID=A0A7C8KQ41_9BACI|nr:hypothetical protein [Gracilibacillus oryzae]KAB8135754.1 hypothetical protein F9U64_10810 [Gracilibacillus oryzae]
MISWSTLFHPIALDLLIIPVAVVLGIVLALITKKVLIGFLSTIFSFILFNIWFWGYFYKSGSYGVKLSLNDMIIYFMFAGITLIISKALLYRKSIKSKNS